MSSLQRNGCEKEKKCMQYEALPWNHKVVVMLLKCNRDTVQCGQKEQTVIESDDVPVVTDCV